MFQAGQNGNKPRSRSADSIDPIDEEAAAAEEIFDFPRFAVQLFREEVRQQFACSHPRVVDVCLFFCDARFQLRLAARDGYPQIKYAARPGLGSWR